MALTAREQDVLRLVARGWTNRRVGAELFISEKTVSVHLSNVMAKLGASGRTDAVSRAHRAGLLTLQALTRAPAPTVGRCPSSSPAWSRRRRSCCPA